MKKMRAKYLIFLSILTIALSHSLYSQTPELKIINKAFKNPINNFDTTYSWYGIFNVPDTANISYIHVTMGTSDGSGDIVDHAFEFDRDAALPIGLSYRRDSNEIKIGLGNHPIRTYFLEITIEDSLNNLSTPMNWNN